jgi:hypothetical protein
MSLDIISETGKEAGREKKTVRKTMMDKFTL